MKISPNKKAQEGILFFMFQLILIVAAGSLLMYYVVSVSSNEILNRLYLSRDIALSSNAVLSAPGNLEYNYLTPKGLAGFEYDIKKSEVEVKKEKGLATYPIINNLAYETHSWSIKDEFYFYLNGFTLEAQNNPKSITPKLKYPYADTSESMMDVAVSFYDHNLLAKSIAVDLKTNEKDLRSITSADVLIIAEIDPTTSKTVKIEIPNDPKFAGKSRKLASLIIDRIIGQENVSKVIIIPADIVGMDKANATILITKSQDTQIASVSQSLAGRTGAIEKYYVG
jgi:hypothetical protein